MCPNVRHKELFKLNKNEIRKVIVLSIGYCPLRMILFVQVFMMAEKLLYTLFASVRHILPIILSILVDVFLNPRNFMFLFIVFRILLQPKALFETDLGDSTIDLWSRGWVLF